MQSWPRGGAAAAARLDGGDAAMAVRTTTTLARRRSVALSRPDLVKRPDLCRKRDPTRREERREREKWRKEGLAVREGARREGMRQERKKGVIWWSKKKDKKEEVVELLRRLELGEVSDDQIRRLIKVELDRRIQWGYKSTYEQQTADVVNFAHSLRKLSIATEVDTLDSEMYEVPISFLKIMFGNTIKGSCAYFKDDSVTLDEAEIAMLDLYCERSLIKDGQRVLDLGINNLTNVEIKLADIATHEMEDRYDRILVIELIEHMKNYELLLRKISEWLTPDGLLFIEHICHKTFAYHYEPLDEDDWFTEYIFPAGTMIIPSSNFLLYFQDDVTVVNHWTLSGKHYSRTHESWLKNIDANVEAVKKIMLSFTGSEEASVKQMNYWRGFNLSGMELYKYRNGEEWMASHVLFKKK
ncbi:hypothetical protein Syun_031687 [Stephania yunnanensis]|uniref:Uncharacterized protein n=1 Tax=Stephania yunnanensis TaxID=152371 RepID=A0AAP0HCC6_9MAGN